MSELTDANEALTKEAAALAQSVDELRATLRRRNVDLENAVSNWQEVSKELHHVEASLAALEHKVRSQPQRGVT